MKKLFSILLSAALLSGLMVTGASAATLQSNQAVYQLSQDPLGTEPFSYSATETHSATLVPVGTAIQSGGDGLLLVEVFLYHEAEKHWNLDSMLSGQSQLTIRDGDHIYHISTMDPSSSEPNAVLDRGIWVKGQSTGEVQPVTVTGEPVDDWAANLVHEAIAKDQSLHRHHRPRGAQGLLHGLYLRCEQHRLRRRDPAEPGAGGHHALRRLPEAGRYHPASGGRSLL